LTLEKDRGSEDRRAADRLDRQHGFVEEERGQADPF
jgi:hypothetical protein